jgi:hypothetical protein
MIGSNGRPTSPENVMVVPPASRARHPEPMMWPARLNAVLIPGAGANRV